MNDLLDFLYSILFELVGSGDVLLGPLSMLHGVPVPDHHRVLSLLFILGHQGTLYHFFITVQVQSNVQNNLPYTVKINH